MGFGEGKLGPNPTTTSESRSRPALFRRTQTARSAALKRFTGGRESTYRRETEHQSNQSFSRQPGNRNRRRSVEHVFIKNHRPGEVEKPIQRECSTPSVDAPIVGSIRIRRLACPDILNFNESGAHERPKPPNRTVVPTSDWPSVELQRPMKDLLDRDQQIRRVAVFILTLAISAGAATAQSSATKSPAEVLKVVEEAINQTS